MLNHFHFGLNLKQGLAVISMMSEVINLDQVNIWKHRIIHQIIRRGIFIMDDGFFKPLKILLHFSGSMYDWSNYWARGIRCRQSVRPDIPYAGFFSQLGQLHTIYHIW